MDRARRRRGNPDLPRAESFARRILTTPAAAAAASLAVVLPRDEPPHFSIGEPAAPHAPESAITRLIQGIWATRPERARALLRSRIYLFSDLPPGDLDHGMLDVAAKRMTVRPWRNSLAPAPAPAEPHPDQASPTAAAVAVTFAPSPPDEALIARAGTLLAQGSPPLAVALALRDELPRPDGPRATADRPVIALAVGPDGTLLGAAANRNGRNRTLHAELNLVQGWWARQARPLPAGTRVYVTLQCCRMCAAALWQTAADPATLRVYFAEPDPGPLARGTVLQPDSHARRRAAVGHPEWLGLRPEHGPHEADD